VLLVTNKKNAKQTNVNSENGVIKLLSRLRYFRLFSIKVPSNVSPDSSSVLTDQM
jgi:hypothetical protein